MITLATDSRGIQHRITLFAVYMYVYSILNCDQSNLTSVQVRSGVLLALDGRVIEFHDAW